MTLRKFLMAISAGLLVAAVGAAFLFWSELRTPYFGATESEVFVGISRGASSSTIARRLTDAGVLRAGLPFVLYLRWSGLARQLKAGEYRFAGPATPIDVARRIAAGDVYYVSVVIPEGMTARETVELVSKSGVGNIKDLRKALHRTDWIRDLSPDARDLEGFLFPATYRFSRSATTEEILHAMLAEFRARFAVLTARAAIPSGWNAERIVTLASIIEKEVKSPSERPLVASVMMNRLRAGMPLGVDASIIFALKMDGTYDGNLHKSDLGMESPYNTYIHRGLPPGPIASPGEASLEAALKPAQSDYFYYVSRNDGTHQFSTDYRSHEEAVARYQKPLRRSHGLPRPGSVR